MLLSLILFCPTQPPIVLADTGLAQHAEDMLNIGVDLQDNSTCLLAVVNALEDDQKKLALAIENGNVSTQAALIEALGVTEVNFKLALKKGQDEAIDRTCAILVPKYQVLENLIVSKRDCNWCVLPVGLATDLAAYAVLAILSPLRHLQADVFLCESVNIVSSLYYLSYVIILEYTRLHILMAKYPQRLHQSIPEFPAAILALVILLGRRVRPLHYSQSYMHHTPLRISSIHFILHVYSLTFSYCQDVSEQKPSRGVYINATTLILRLICFRTYITVAVPFTKSA